MKKHAYGLVGAQQNAASIVAPGRRATVSQVSVRAKPTTHLAFLPGMNLEFVLDVRSETSFSREALDPSAEAHMGQIQLVYT